MDQPAATLNILKMWLADKRNNAKGQHKTIENEAPGEL
jgi:hypothetical protein